MAKKRWAVRVTILENPATLVAPKLTSELYMFLEQLRYMGIVSVKSNESDDFTTIDIQCPDKLPNADYWAKSNSSRMQSFGYTAVPVEL